jgi:hypothetical protein
MSMFQLITIIIYKNNLRNNLQKLNAF